MGKYRYDLKITMSEYVLNLVRQAKLLILPMSDNEIINALKRYFSVDVVREIKPAIVSNLKDLTKLLNIIEQKFLRSSVSNKNKFANTGAKPKQTNPQQTRNLASSNV